MHKKKIITIGPVSAQSEDMASIASTLSFLDEDYDVDYLDSLSIMENVPNQTYYELWKQKLTPCVNEYDAFLGFSFGGVIIQQCFPLFATHLHKPIILFSTPTFADTELIKKLGKVIQLCHEKKLEEALNALYQPVFYPNPMPALSINTIDEEQAYARLIFGLSRVLNTDSTTALQENTVEHTHLIGEYSDLVNKSNVAPPNNGHLEVVPKASMRVLQDNPSFCQKVIMEILNHEDH